MILLKDVDRRLPEPHCSGEMAARHEVLRTTFQRITRHGAWQVMEKSWICSGTSGSWLAVAVSDEQRCVRSFVRRIPKHFFNTKKDRCSK
jgi:hypothetical protein